jgi:hypothetical protein
MHMPTANHSPCPTIRYLHVRPSSHSEDYTIVAHHKTPELAKEGLTNLERFLRKLVRHQTKHEWDTPLDTDWHPSMAGLKQDGTKVVFQVYTDGFIKQIVAIMRETKPTKVNVKSGYIAIHMWLTVPKKITMKLLPLMLNKQDAEIVTALMNQCGKPESIVQHRKHFYRWHYQGTDDKISKVRYDILDLIDPPELLPPKKIKTRWRITYA